MRRNSIAITAIATALMAGLMVPAAPAATTGAARDDAELVRTEHIVKTKHGKIYVEVLKRADVKKAPAILTYSPYSKLWEGLNGTRTADDLSQHWAQKSYARVWADVVGTGNSGGCFDYGGDREKETGAAIVEWIADQKWSTGKVGMIGGSYEGTTATAAATQNPKHLTTIVPEAAISRWYEYAYSGGVRYSWTTEFLGHQGPGSAADEGFDTPLAFDFGLALPPPTDPQNSDWQGRVASNITPCEEIQHTEHGYDMTPNYDKFWVERDYIVDADKIDIPVLISHNWGDWNVKQEEAWNLFRALKNSPKKVLYMGTRWAGHGTPGGKYAKTVDAWFDHYLMGKNNGIQNLPSVITQSATNEKSLKFTYGMPKTRNVKLWAQEIPAFNADDTYTWEMHPSKPRPSPLFPSGPAEFTSAGVNLEVHQNHHWQMQHEWITFESPPLKQDVRIFGTPKVQIYSHVYRKWVTYSPVIIDIDHDHHYTNPISGQHIAPKDTESIPSVTRGFHDSRYRNSLKKPQPVKSGVPFAMDVTLKPVDYTFEAGHQIGLTISTELLEWMVPKVPYDCENMDASCRTAFIHWSEGKTTLDLPIVRPPRDVNDLFCTGLKIKHCGHRP